MATEENNEQTRCAVLEKTGQDIDLLLGKRKNIEPEDEPSLKKEVKTWKVIIDSEEIRCIQCFEIPFSLKQCKQCNSFVCETCANQNKITSAIGFKCP